MTVRAFVPRAVVAALVAVGAAPASALAPHGVSAQCQWVPVTAGGGAVVVVASATSTGTEVPVATSVSCTITAAGVSHTAGNTAPGAHTSAAAAVRGAPAAAYETCFVGTVTYADGHAVTLAGCL